MKIKQVGLNRVLILAGAIVAVSMIVSQAERTGLAQPTPEGKKQQAQMGTIEETKQKGFEGVDFSYDVFGAPPGQDPQKIADEVMKKDIAQKPDVMKKQHKLLSERYDLNCRTEKGIAMSRGKPQPIGPAVKLASGMTWDQLAQLSPEDIKKKGVFPQGFDRLPHVKHAVGGQVFPQVQIKEFPRLERFDVDFDLPECLLPEFPPPIFLTTHPELGDVSQGEVVHAENFDRLFRGLVTPAQLDGLRMLVTQFAQEEFNATHDRKTAKPSLGVSCLDCHVNFHT
ncbi:MAG TPA: hypothetical protein VFE29_01925, partial [Terriglobia bacterium]|nr:hypothetical protein [Terriglobia bacterium]